MWICSAKSFLLMPPPCKLMKALIPIDIQIGEIGERFLVKTVPSSLFPGNFDVAGILISPKEK